MGYARYNLPDGREAGYAVEATCDQPGCTTTINRGLAHLCGEPSHGHLEPGETSDGHLEPGEPGCGRYYCLMHRDDGDHDCPNPRCPEWDPDENETCTRAKDHEGKHVSESEIWENAR